ncbi:Transcriptional repressor, CopY family [Candidatus Sulfotelmatobacter kueseliae]|uniref:Transcriptional repressor, CopY family n=1 Tax=Candidatus Sulfotelmatobacter kueseliae TaxID=2042962 RepID=A0A2U3KRN3_9BACT|nr:Transcriptional repressor, CopY family [Candidatus Sulfotelmatobacter kueseliae]
MPKAQLTRLELQMMQVLWENGPSTVQMVQQDLSGERLAYTTVQTMLNILQRKGKVKRKLLGKAYEYRPVLSRDKALREAASDMLDRVFGGSVETLLMSLVKSNQLDADKLAKVQKLIESQERADTEEQHGRD